jgi:hypothetical protein
LRTDRESIEQSVEKLVQLVTNLARVPWQDPGANI